MEDPAEETSEIAVEADMTANDPIPPTAVATRPNGSIPVAVRLSPEDVAAIGELASAMNVPSSTLIRGWIRQGLAAREKTTVHSAIDQIALDVQRLREVLA